MRRPSMPSMNFGCIENLIVYFFIFILIVGALGLTMSGEGITKTTQTNALQIQGCNPIDYTVVSGDTLFAIGRKHGSPYQDIMRYNGLTTETINVGQTIIIPMGECQ